MALRTPLSERIGIEFPFMQAGMGGIGPITLARLAAAISEAGALGTIAQPALVLEEPGISGDALAAQVAMVVEQVRDGIRLAVSLTDKPLAINVRIAQEQPDAEHVVRAIIDERASEPEGERAAEGADDLRRAPAHVRAQRRRASVRDAPLPRRLERQARPHREGGGHGRGHRHRLRGGRPRRAQAGAQLRADAVRSRCRRHPRRLRGGRRRRRRARRGARPRRRARLHRLALPRRRRVRVPRGEQAVHRRGERDADRGRARLLRPCPVHRERLHRKRCESSSTTARRTWSGCGSRERRCAAAPSRATWRPG